MALRQQYTLYTALSRVANTVNRHKSTRRPYQ